MSEWEPVKKDNLKVKHIHYDAFDSDNQEAKTEQSIEDASISQVDGIRKSAIYVSAQQVNQEEEEDRPDTAGFEYGRPNAHLSKYPKQSKVMDHSGLEDDAPVNDPMWLPRPRGQPRDASSSKKELSSDTSTSFYSPKKPLTIKPFRSNKFRRPLGWDAFVSSKHS